MAKLTRIWSREILDSRGVPTVEAGVQLDSGVVAVSSSPSGTSRGTFSAHELRDNDEARYKGKGVLKAVENVNTVLGPGLISSGVDPFNQHNVDQKLVEMDGTEDKSKLGANSLVAVSMAVAKAAAAANGYPLYKWIAEISKQIGIPGEAKVPTPIFNMINGGLHGAGNLDFQEFFCDTCKLQAVPRKTAHGSRGIHGDRGESCTAWRSSLCRKRGWLCSEPVYEC